MSRILGNAQRHIMKMPGGRFHTLALFGLLASVVGCGKSDTFPVRGCEDAGRAVLEVFEQTGICSYNQNTKHYHIRHHIPETYDQVFIGIVCNMPEEFKQQSGTREVIFSGVFKEIQHDTHSGPVGTEFHLLELTDISLKQEN